MLTRWRLAESPTPDKGNPPERVERKATGLRPTGYGRRAAEGGWDIVPDVTSANAASRSRRPALRGVAAEPIAAFAFAAVVLLLASCFAAHAHDASLRVAHGALAGSLPSPAEEAIGVREGPAAGVSEQSVPGELIVKFKPGVSAANRAATAATEGAVLQRYLLAPGYALVRVPPGREEEFLARLEANPQVQMAERNVIRRATFTPNDTYYSYQWDMPQIRMPQAWGHRLEVSASTHSR
jgi:hypothetical protein